MEGNQWVMRKEEMNLGIKTYREGVSKSKGGPGGIRASRSTCLSKTDVFDERFI